MASAKSLAKIEDIAGINIAEGMVSAARLVRKGRQKITLTHAGWLEYEPEATDQDIIATIRKLWKKSRMPTRTVCCGMDTRTMCLKYFKYPDLAPRELVSALKLEAEESLQLPPEELILDWHLNRPKNNPYTPLGEKLHGMMVAVERKRVNQKLNLLKAAGLYPVIMDIGCTSLCNLFLTLRGDRVNDYSAVCVVNLSRYNADINILYNDHFIYPRSIISKSADWSNKAQYLIENISDALLYYHVKVDNTPVTQLILTGYVPRDPEFVGQIHDTIGLPTDIWSPLNDKNFEVVNNIKVSSREEIVSPVMVTSLGLALRNI